MRTSKEVIMNSLFLRSHALSLREVKRIINKLKGVRRSHVTVYNWVLKFAPKLVQIEKSMPLQFTKIWHVDEKFIRVRGSKDPFAYLWVVADSNSNIIAIHVSDSRSTEHAKIVLRKARERAGFAPDIIVTDGLQGYKRACTIFGRKCKHVVAHFQKEKVYYRGKLLGLSNNRIERVNGFFALWLHACRGLKSFSTAEIWLEFFVIHYNYLKPRGEEEKNLVEWQEIPAILMTRND
jgi:transposase-like protein